jgi:hypothetical protein
MPSSVFEARTRSTPSSRVDALVNCGFLEKIGGTWKVPMLYRDGLDITQGKAFAPEEPSGEEGRPGGEPQEVRSSLESRTAKLRQKSDAALGALRTVPPLHAANDGGEVGTGRKLHVHREPNPGLYADVGK